MKFFLIGVKGSGMASLASLLDDEGYYVSGSDVWHKCLTDNKLLSRGIHRYKLDDKEYLKSDVIIIGHDFYKEELIDELNKKNKVYFEYHEFLNFYLQKEKLISILPKNTIVLSGHTHIPVLYEKEQVKFVNPGSISIPKSEDGKCYGIIEISESKKSIEIKGLFDLAEKKCLLF